MKKRIFTAIDISDEARQKAAAYIENLRREFSGLRVGWDKPEKLHLTLKFLGDTDEARLCNLTEAVEETAKRISNFDLRIKATGVFPSQRNARILWLGVCDEKRSSSKLNEILETESAKKGFTRETRNFKAHLTMARLREPDKSGELVEKHLSNDFDSAEFAVSEITIYESQLLKSGSIYSVVSKHQFKQDGNFSIRA